MSDPFDAAPDYELLWPRELFIRELTALQAIQPANERTPQVERLLEEAFLGDTPALDYKSFDTGDYIAELLVHAPLLREHRTRSPYWSARHGAVTRGPSRSLDNCASTSRS